MIGFNAFLPEGCTITEEMLDRQEEGSPVAAVKVEPQVKVEPGQQDPEQLAEFLPSSQYVGFKNGYIFQVGPSGLGYYLDTLDWGTGDDRYAPSEPQEEGLDDHVQQEEARRLKAKTRLRKRKDVEQRPVHRWQEPGRSFEVHIPMGPEEPPSEVEPFSGLRLG